MGLPNNFETNRFKPQVLSQDSGMKAHLRRSVHQNWELTGDNHRRLFLEMAAVNFPPFFPLCGYGPSWALQAPTRALLTGWPPETPAEARRKKPQAAGEGKLRVRPGAKAPPRRARARAQEPELRVGSLERLSGGGAKNWMLNSVKASFNFSIL